MMHNKNQKLSFRPDINALRAVAVLSVLFYHFQVPGFGGGYVGVDVFFVISGFLFTQIIHTKLSAGRFSLAEFYIARIRRILPALAVLIISLLLAGYFWLAPLDYLQLGKQARSATLFFSNVFFAHKGGYFETESRERWLLHTWSLSVEGQFYLLWPFFLLALRRGNEKFLKQSVITVLILSLAWSIIATRRDSAAAFFALAPRVWEFAAGSLVYFYKDRLKLVKGLAEAGLILIFAAVFFYSTGMAYPGYWAILPVAGAALVIAGQSKKYYLANGFMQFFGNISYSLYLWHWPVMVGAKYLDVAFTPINVCGLMALAVVLAHMSYALVENPLRRELDWKISLGIGLCAVLASCAVLAGQGLPARVPADVRQAEQAREDSNPHQSACLFDKKTKLPECRLGASGAPSIAIWGDSHANALFVVLDKALAADKRTALFYSYSGCAPVRGAFHAANTSGSEGPVACEEFNDLAWSKIVSNTKIKDVVMISRWSRYFDKAVPLHGATPQEIAAEYSNHIIDTACTLTKQGKNVYIVDPIPEMDRDVPEALAKSRLLHHTDIDIETSLKDYSARHEVVLKAFSAAEKKCHIHILDPKPYLCNKNSCAGVKDGMSLYQDDNHLTVAGSLLLKPLFSSAVMR